MLMLAQLPIDPQTVTDLANKDFKWWFAAMLLLFILSGMYMFRMLMGQLNEQRLAHSTSVTELITYLKDDRLAAMTVLQNVGKTIEQVNTTLARIDVHLSQTKL